MKKIIYFILLFASTLSAFGAKRYWIGNGTSKNWNDTANWSATSGGASGSSVPGSSDTAYFNGGGTGQCVLDMNISLLRLEILSGYSDSLKQNNRTITIGASGYSQTGGTFYGDSTDITLSGAFSLTGGLFRSTKTTLSTSANFTINGGTFSHNAGKVMFTNTLTITGSATFKALEFAGGTTSKTFTIASGTALTVTGDFIQSTGASGGIIINTGTVNAQGDIYVTSISGGGGNAYVNVNGTGDQSIYGSTSTIFTGRLPHLVINKSSGNLNLYNKICILGDFTYTAGTVVYGTSTVNFCAQKTISGSVSLYDVVFSNGTSAGTTITLSSGTNITVINNLTFDGFVGAGWWLYTNGGTITAKGHITDNNQQGGAGGTTTILINGTGNQTLTGSGANNKHFLPNININKSSGTLTLASKIPVAGNWTYTAGTVSAGTSEVVFAWNKTISGSHTLNAVGFYYTGTTPVTITIASGTTLTVNGTYKHYGFNPCALLLNTGTIEAKGDIDLTAANGFGGGNAILKISGTGNQTIYGHSTGGGFLPSVEINKSSGTLSFSNKITAAGNYWTYTAGTINAGTSTMQFYGAPTITGSMSFNNLTFYAGGNVTATLGSATQLTATNLSFIGTTQSTGTTINSGTIAVSGNITHSRLLYGGGTTNVILNGSTNQTIYGRGSAGSYIAHLPNLIVDKSGGNVTVDSSVTVKGRLTLKGSANYQMNGTHDGTILVSGDSVTLASNSKASSGSATIKIAGTGAQRLSGSGNGRLPKLTIAKTGTLTISGTVNAGNDWTYTSGSLVTAGSTVSFDSSLTISGSHTLNNVSVAPTSASTVTIASGTTLTALATLSFGGSAGITVNTGTIAATGSVTVSNTVTTGGGSATININGTGGQSMTGTGAATALPLCNVIINKSAGALAIGGTSLSFGGDLQHSAGSVTVDTVNTVYLYGTDSINAANITFGSVHVKQGTRTLTADLNVFKNLEIASGAKLNAAGTAHHITLQGNWINSSGGGANGFASGTGFVNFTGTKNQTITEPGGVADTIAHFKINKPAGTLTLNSPVNISDSLTLTAGKITSDTSNLLVVMKRAVTSGAGASSFVAGPVKKIGNTAYVFPIGKATNYQPLSITAPSATTDAYVAEYFNSSQPYGTATGDSIAGISTCEYWKLSRKAGTSTVSATSGWNAASCAIDTNLNMRLAYWNGSQWNNLGGINPTGNSVSGTVTTLPIALAALPLGSYTPIAHAKLCKISVAITSSVPSDTLCQGQSLTLTANPSAGVTFFPVNSYTWTNSNNGNTASTQTLSVNVTGTYSVTAGNAIGCNVKDSEYVYVVPALTVSVNSETIFLGGTATLTATGGTTYTWTPSTALSATTGSVVNANPSTTIIYTVTGTTYSCPASATSTVTVLPDSLPDIDQLSCFCISSFAPIPGNKYIVSAWAREDGAAATRTSFTHPEIHLVFASGGGNYLSAIGPIKPSGKIIDGWQRIEQEFTVPLSAYYLVLRLQSASGDVLFDDVRVFPRDGSMKSYVYDPETMRLVAELDERNYATHYEYDEEGKLTRVKKETESGTMTIKESRNSSPKQ